MQTTIAISPILNGVIGTRWLTRWDKEIDLCVNLLYYGLTIGRGELKPLVGHAPDYNNALQRNRH